MSSIQHLDRSNYKNKIKQKIALDLEQTIRIVQSKLRMSQIKMNVLFRLAALEASQTNTIAHASHRLTKAHKY
jgi:hypothetical protein